MENLEEQKEFSTDKETEYAVVKFHIPLNKTFSFCKRILEESQKEVTAINDYFANIAFFSKKEEDFLRSLNLLESNLVDLLERTRDIKNIIEGLIKNRK